MLSGGFKKYNPWKRGIPNCTALTQDTYHISHIYCVDAACPARTGIYTYMHKDERGEQPRLTGMTVDEDNKQHVPIVGLLSPVVAVEGECSLLRDPWITSPWCNVGKITDYSFFIKLQ